MNSLCFENAEPKIFMSLPIPWENAFNFWLCLSRRAVAYNWHQFPMLIQRERERERWQKLKNSNSKKTRQQMSKEEELAVLLHTIEEQFRQCWLFYPLEVWTENWKTKVKSSEVQPHITTVEGMQNPPSSKCIPDSKWAWRFSNVFPANDINH